jgi:O-antigen/teichoic acid export membrane protein
MSNILLARLLDPEAFGLMAVASTINITLEVISDLGVRQNILRENKPHSDNHLAAAWQIQFIRGLILWIVSIIIAIILNQLADEKYMTENIYRNKQLPLLICLTTLGAVLAGAQSLSTTLAARNLNQKRLVLNDIVTQIIGTSVIITSAWALHSVYALVIGQLTMAVLNCILSHQIKPKQKIHFVNFYICKQILFESRWISLSSIIGVGAHFGDRFILAAFVDAEKLGMYSLALVILGAVDMLGGQILSKTIVPIANSSNSPETVANRLKKIRLVIDPIYMVSAGIILIFSHKIVTILYDNRYNDTALIMQILSISLILSRYNIFQQIFLARGQTSRLPIISILRLVPVALMLPAALYYGNFMLGISVIALKDLPASIYMLKNAYSDKIINMNFEFAMYGLLAILFIFLWPISNFVNS